MNDSLSEGLNTPFSEFQVPREFDYQDYLGTQAKIICVAIAANHPRPTMAYLPHPKETHGVEGSAYHRVGEVYCNMARQLPHSLLVECKGDKRLAQSQVVQIARIALDPHFQRRRFVWMLRQELQTLGFRYLILADVANHGFASHLFANCREPHTGVELLPNQVNEGVVSLPSFAIRLD